jgi:hypothetical protein
MVYNSLNSLRPWSNTNTGNKASVSFLTLQADVVLEVLVSEIRQEKVWAIQIGPEEVKWSLFADEMNIYIENPKYQTKNQNETR